MTWSELWGKIKDFLTRDIILTSIFKVVIALIILFVSFKIINVVTRRIEKRALKKHADKTITKTLMYVLRIVLKIIITTCLIGFVGINTSGITALITSLGVCVGLAVNGALSNIAGGVVIILTRPFKVDDYIEAQDYSGTVEEIRLNTTKIVTPDNKVIYIPNGALSSGTIINYSEKDLRRIEFEFCISYSADFEKAKSIVQKILVEHPLVKKEIPVFVRMSEHADSSIKIKARAWVDNSKYWDLNFDIIETVKKEFDNNNIEIPFNQLDVHVKHD